MNSRLKWALILLALAAAVVVGFFAVPGQRPDSMTATGSDKSAPSSGPGSPASPSPPPSPGGAANVDVPAVVQAPLLFHAVDSFTATDPVLALGWAFDFPWPPLADHGEGRDGVRLNSAAGHHVLVHPLLQAVDWNTQYLDASDDARSWLEALEKKSPYSFYEAVLSVTGRAAGNMAADRFRLATEIKDALCPPGITSVYAFAVNGLRGFQLGGPPGKRVAIYLLPLLGDGVVIDIVATNAATFTQGELDHLIGSLARHPATK